MGRPRDERRDAATRAAVHERLARLPDAERGLPMPARQEASLDEWTEYRHAIAGTGYKALWVRSA